MKVGWKKIVEYEQRLNLRQPTVLKAKELFAKAQDSDLLKGKKLEAKVAAVIVVASQMTRFKKSIKEVSQIFDLPQKKINACVNILKQDIL